METLDKLEKDEIKLLEMYLKEYDEKQKKTKATDTATLDELMEFLFS